MTVHWLDAFASLPTIKDGRDVVLPASSGVDHMYKIAESQFAATAHRLVDMGWSIFPQQTGGNRQPGTVDGRMIKWSEEHNLSIMLPKRAVLDLWCSRCPTLNTAVVFGPATSNAFMLDIDITEPDLAQRVEELAEEILGRSPLRRIGRAPKLALVYRHGPEDTVPSRSPKFAVGPGETPDQGVEIISAGKPMTFFGTHHGTGRYFVWTGLSPLEAGPTAAPLVTSAQVNDFLDAVDSVRQFHKSASLESTITTWEYDPEAGINVPRMRSTGAQSEWTENEDGIVSDGREAYLRELVFRIARHNPSHIGDAQGRDKLCSLARETFVTTAETTGRWKGASLDREIRLKMDHVCGRISRGEVAVGRLAMDSTGEFVATGTTHAQIPAQPRDPAGDSLDFLPAFSASHALGGHARQPIKVDVLEPEEGAFEQRAIQSDRTSIAKSVADGLLTSFAAFFDEVYDETRSETRVHVLKAPTGAGKTSRSIRWIAEDARTKDDYRIVDPDGSLRAAERNPILYLLPTYANIEELRHRALVLNLDPNLPDDDLRTQAEGMGLISEDDLPRRVNDLRAEARNAGLVTMLYQGKLRAGCRMAEKVSLAMAAGMGTGGFCKAEVDTGQRDDRDQRIMKEKRCEFYDSCEAILQRERISKCHVVFMPHAFLGLNVPEELKNVRCVVADERIHHLFLHTTQMSLGTLRTARADPRLTKKEKAQGVDPADYQIQRDDAVAIVEKAILEKRCPAEALLDLGVDMLRRGSRQATPFQWVEAARKVCSSAIQRDGSVTPEMTLEEVAELCAQPTGVEVREEHRFWTIIHERMEARMRDENLVQLAAVSGVELGKITMQARGDRDMRLQLLTVTPEQRDGDKAASPEQYVRLSWRSSPNWTDRPLLLLDASAAPEMIRKIWGGKDVVVHDIPATLNVRVVGVVDRTFSNSSILSSAKAPQQIKVSASKLLTKVRSAITSISSLYGWSRVVAGGSIILRKAVNTDWAGPDNVDWCHYGAMRGLDFAKHHEAAISIGRMELPVSIVDGLVAALTYDDDEPEEPFDVAGTGAAMVPNGVQTVMMRSGHDVRMPVPMFPGRWGRMIQKQYREEELLQFLGRLRPVYREGPAPIWFSLTSIIPEGVVVDDLITTEDLLKAGGRLRRSPNIWEAVRLADGVLDHVLAHAVADHLYNTPRAASEEMKGFGFDPIGRRSEGRCTWGFSGFSWRDGKDGPERMSWVRGDIEDQEGHLLRILRAYLGADPHDVRRHCDARAKSNARGRLPDKIEEELGVREARREGEQRVKDGIGVKAVMNARPEAFAENARRREPVLPIRLPIAGIIGDEDQFDAEGNLVTLLVDEFAAYEAIEAVWGAIAAKASENAARLPKPVPANDPAEASFDTFDDDDHNIPW